MEWGREMCIFHGECSIIPRTEREERCQNPHVVATIVKCIYVYISTHEGGEGRWRGVTPYDNIIYSSVGK